jgi:hypothetical protein
VRGFNRLNVLLIIEVKRMNCRDVKREIGIMGTKISIKARAHLKNCSECSHEYEKAEKLEIFLLSARETEAPPALKQIVLQRKNQKRSGNWIGILNYTLRAAAISLILIFGFWLGLQTANNDTEDLEKYSELIENPAYSINTAPLNPNNLGEMYFAILEEAEDEQ